MKALLINLDKRPDRREFMEKQLQRLGLEWERIPGVDGMALSEEEIGTLYDEASAMKEHGVPLTRGHIGCSLAHARAYEYVVDNNLPAALILEDDVVLPDTVPSILKELEDSKKGWDFMHISYPPMNWAWLKSWFHASWKRTKQNPLFCFYVLIKVPYMLVLFVFEILREYYHKHFGSGFVRFLRPVYHLGAYVITNEGARKLVSVAYPVRYCADQLVNKCRVEAGMRFYGYCPPPAYKSGSFSSNTV